MRLRIVLSLLLGLLLPTCESLGVEGLAALTGLVPGLAGIIPGVPPLAGVPINPLPILNAIGGISGAASLTGVTLINVAALVGYIASYKEQVEEYIASKAEARSSRRKSVRVPQFLAPPSKRSYPHRQQRSTDELEMEEVEQLMQVEELFMSSISRLDHDGCVMKLLCHLDNKGADGRTPEENAILQEFSKNQETLSSYNNAFVSAIKEGQSLQLATCDQVFPRCPLRGEDMDGLLRNSLGCGNNLF